MSLGGFSDAFAPVHTVVLPSRRWAEIERVFARAAELPEHERGAFLAAACADDPDVHSEVASLLANLDGAGDAVREAVAVAIAMYAKLERRDGS